MNRQAWVTFAARCSTSNGWFGLHRLLGQKPVNDRPVGEKYINGHRPSHSASCFQIRPLLAVRIGDP
jgi:hypothetical protein